MRPELQDIVDETSRLLKAATTLEDREFNLIAFGTQPAEIDAVRQASILQRQSAPETRVWFESFGIGTSPGPVRTPADAKLGMLSRICLPARWRGVTYGWLWVLDNRRALDDPDVVEAANLAEHAGAYLAQMNREREDDALAITDLLGSDLDSISRSALRITDRGLISRGVPVVAVVVGIVNPSRENVSLNLWSLPRNVLADPGPHSTTLLVELRDAADLDPAREAAQRILDLYRARLAGDGDVRLVAGIGDPRSDLLQLRSSWMQARVAARVAAAVPSVPAIAEWHDLGLYRLIAAAPDPELAPLIIDDPVQRLLDCPDAELAHTLLAYLDRAGNAKETAADLNIHRQTLYYRLAKAETFTGLSLTDGRNRLRIHAGLMLAPLLHPAPPGSALMHPAVSA